MADDPRPRILIADDEPLFLRTTAQLLSKAGYDCVGAADGRAALALLEQEPFDLLLSDLSMPGNLKLELLEQGRSRWPGMPLIVITGAPSLPSAIESVRLGIADYLLKPVRYEDLLSSVRRTLAHRQAPAAATTPTAEGAFPEIVGTSPPMAELREIIERVATTDANILITGESGTGKEVVAGAIHGRSRRAGKPLQVIDCTAIPESLFESVLFGHAKGSFTGAVKDQEGLLAGADGGTVFFDEIGELPLPLQAKLLRVIQEQTFTPVGRTTPRRIDVRFVSATNRDLEAEVRAGRFRRDLYYRLAVIPIELPPLRARGDDVLLLARYFLERLRGEKTVPADFSPGAIELFRRYDWPGNIRELRNAVEHGLAVTRGDQVTEQDLPATLRRAAGEGSAAFSGVTGEGAMRARPIGAGHAGSRDEALQDAEREYLTSLLRQNGGNVAAAARQARLSRQGLHKLLGRHGIDAAEFRS